MSDAAVRIRKAGPSDVPTIVELSYALSREDAESRDPTMNLEWALQEGRGYFADLLAQDAALQPYRTRLSQVLHVTPNKLG